MKRCGRPCAGTLCHPFEVPGFGGFLPPTFVARPEKNFTWSRTGSQPPQYPAYTFGPRTPIAETWLSMPRLLCPRPKTVFQSVSDEDPVCGPLVVSTIWRPPVSRCFGFDGSITRGA